MKPYAMEIAGLMNSKNYDVKIAQIPLSKVESHDRIKSTSEDIGR
jgi:hypothetical protein